MIKDKRIKVAVVGGLSALLLAGCSGPGMGNAASVNGVKISSERADQTADLLCTLTGLGTEPASRSTVNKRALATLIDLEITKQYAESQGVKADPKLVQALAEQRLALASKVPAADRDEFIAIIKKTAEANDLLIEAGAKLTNQSVTIEKAEELLKAGQLGRLKWEKDGKVKIESAAKYAPGKDGWPSTGGGSVSVASSAFAKDADVKLSGQAEDPEWLASLPKSQRCGG